MQAGERGSDFFASMMDMAAESTTQVLITTNNLVETLNVKMNKNIYQRMGEVTNTSQPIFPYDDTAQVESQLV